MRTLVLLARKGGAGKTTTAVHLAVAAVQAGRRVLLIDADPQRSAAGWWRARQADAPELVECDADQVRSVVEAARVDGVGLVVVDTRPSVEADTVTMARLADLVLIPTRPSILDLRAIAGTVEVAQAVRAQAFILLNAVPAGRGDLESGITIEARTALSGYPVPTCPVVLGARAAFSHALVDGQAVTEFDPHGRAASELQALFRFVEELLWPNAQP